MQADHAEFAFHADINGFGIVNLHAHKYDGGGEIAVSVSTCEQIEVG